MRSLLFTNLLTSGDVCHTLPLVSRYVNKRLRTTRVCPSVVVCLFTLAKAEAPKMLRSHMTISVQNLSAYRYCSGNCRLQSFPPPVKREVQHDFHLLCVVRHAVSELRPSMDTSTAFALLRSKYDADGEPAKSEWVMATPIYSIMAKLDSAVQGYHGLRQVAITLQNPCFSGLWCFYALNAPIGR